MKSQEVYRFSNKVKLLLKSLDGVEISGSEYKIKQFDKLYSDLEKEVDKFSPTIQEEFSFRTRKLYNKMITAKKYLNNLKELNSSKDEIKYAESDYNKCIIEYENSKKIRDSLKF